MYIFVTASDKEFAPLIEFYLIRMHLVTSDDERVVVLASRFFRISH